MKKTIYYLGVVIALSSCGNDDNALEAPKLVDATIEVPQSTNSETRSYIGNVEKGSDDFTLYWEDGTTVYSPNADVIKVKDVLGIHPFTCTDGTGVFKGSWANDNRSIAAGFPANSVKENGITGEDANPCCTFTLAHTQGTITVGDETSFARPVDLALGWAPTKKSGLGMKRVVSFLYFYSTYPVAEITCSDNISGDMRVTYTSEEYATLDRTFAQFQTACTVEMLSTSTTEINFHKIISTGVQNAKHVSEFHIPDNIYEFIVAIPGGEYGPTGSRGTLSIRGSDGNGNYSPRTRSVTSNYTFVMGNMYYLGSIDPVAQ